MTANPEGSDNGPEQERAPLEERADTAEAQAYGEAGYITPEREFDHKAIIEKMTGLIGKAVAKSTKDRASVCITRRVMMQHIFPKVVGPEGFADTADPELSKEVYRRLNSTLWRYTATAPNGPIQSSLNSDQSLVLLRTKVNPHNIDAVYSTRDLGCILADAIKAQRANEKKRADREAAFTVMLIERIPEHGERFNRELVGGLQTALKSAKAITAGPLAALNGNAVDDDDVEDDAAAADNVE